MKFPGGLVKTDILSTFDITNGQTNPIMQISELS